MPAEFYSLPSQVAQRRDLTCAEKLVIAILVTRIGENGFCWPGIRRIAEDAGVATSTVQRAVEDLKKKGLIDIESGGSGHSNHYRLNELGVPKIGTGCTENEYTGVPKTSTPLCRKSVHKRKEKRTVEKNNKTSPCEGDLFDRFWVVYPRRIDKRKAKTAYIRILTKAKDPEALADTIQTAVEAQVAAGMLRPKDKYTKYPTTWLNAEAWNNEITQVTTNARDNPTDDSVFEEHSPRPLTDEEIADHQKFLQQKERPGQKKEIPA